MKIPKKIAPFLVYLFFYLVLVAFVCFMLSSLLGKSIEASEYFYGGRPTPVIVAAMDSIGGIGWVFPIAVFLMGILAGKFYDWDQFYLIMYVNVSFLVLFFYVVTMVFAAAYAWAPFKLVH